MDKLKKHVIKYLAVIWLLVLLFLSINIVAFAKPKVSSNSKTALTISPVKTELDVNPGTRVIKKVMLANNGTDTAIIETEVRDFEADTEGKNPNFVPAGKKSPYSMSGWIKIEPSSFTLEPGKNKTVDIIIKVPKYADPGGHYAAAIFSSVPPAGAQTGVYAKIGSLFLARIPGNEVEIGRIGGLNMPWFIQGGPVDLQTSFVNEGNVHVKPKGAINIIPVGGKTATSISIGGDNVLPGSRRVFGSKWINTPLIGLYRVQVKMSYGSKNKTATSGTHLLLILPVKILSSLLGLFLVGIVLGYLPGKTGRAKAKRAAEKEEQEELEKEKKEKDKKEEDKKEKNKKAKEKNAQDKKEKEKKAKDKKVAKDKTEKNKKAQNKKSKKVND